MLVPDWTYKVLKVKSNGQISCKRLLSSGQSFNVDLDINGVYLVEKAPKKTSEPELLINTPIDNTASQDKAANSDASATATSPEPEPVATQPDEPMTPLMLASLIRAAWSWEEIEAATSCNEQHKKAAWSLLTQKEKDQVLALKLQAQQKER